MEHSETHPNSLDRDEFNIYMHLTDFDVFTCIRTALDLFQRKINTDINQLPSLELQ